MKTIFDQTEVEKFAMRINSLSSNSQRQWGKMNIVQMLKHNVVWNEWIFGKDDREYKQGLLGRIFGKMALRRLVKDDGPMGKNVPAGEFSIKETDGNLERQRRIWLDLLSGYANFSNERFVHDFFGKMTKEEIGILVHKHTDHHLRQFGA